jgi:hypothetical protein
MNPLKHFNRTIAVYSQNGSHAAAAIMGAIACGRPDYDDETKWSKPEKTRPRNPNQLTLLQHIFPTRSIGRLADADGKVEVYDILRGRSRKAKPTDGIFCAKRAWDQRAESGYMLEIENQFQEIAEKVIIDQCGITDVEQKRRVNRFFALWYMRSRHSILKDQEIQLASNIGTPLTLEQEENLERDHYLFIRSGGLVPSRQLNGIWLQFGIDDFSHKLEETVRWGAIRPQSGEFITPDIPRQLLITLTPSLALVGNAPDGFITQEDLAQLNQFTVDGCRAYYLAKELNHCPCGP